jgi:hypothetical protein
VREWQASLDQAGTEIVLEDVGERRELAGAVIAELADGLVYDDSSDSFVSGREALVVAHALEGELTGN